MASTHSDQLRLELQATGENSGTWGTKTNTNLQLLEEAVSGLTAVACDGASDVTLSTANAATDEARHSMIKCTGTLTGNINLIVPSKTKHYIIWNATSGAFTLTVKTSAGTGVAITQGNKDWVFCDATNVEAITVASVGSTVQAWDAQLDDIAALAVTNGNIIVGDGTNWVAESGATARTSLGLAIGTNVQAWDAQLDDIAALAPTASNFIVGDGVNWTLEAPAAALASIGIDGASGNVATGDIADNAVTLAKMAGITAGNLITGNASGDPTAVATGTSGQVLTSNGAGAAPTFQSTGPATDELLKVSSDDTTAGYLDGKLTAGTNISLTVGSPAGNETLAVALTGIGSTIQAWDTHLDAIAALTATLDNFMIGNGTTWILATPATVKTALSLGTLADQNTINGGTDIDANTITATELAANSVGNSELAANAVDNTNLGTGAFASAAQMEAGSATDVAVNPGLTQRHPSNCKMWCHFDQVGTQAIEASYNVTSITDTASGTTTYKWK
jgi:hypothetical protein